MRKRNSVLPVLVLSFLLFECGNLDSTKKWEISTSSGSFESVYNFLKEYDDLILLQQDERMVIVSPALQARVMTSRPSSETL